jgi:hypothetical protein
MTKLHMRKPIWVLTYLIDQDAWWPYEAPHKVRFHAAVHTYCFDTEEAARLHHQSRINPKAYSVHKTWLQTEEPE